MLLVAEKTTIPVPKIHAYCLGDGARPFPSFLILEYVEGQTLSYPEVRELSSEQRSSLYGSLADIYIQLRRLGFPSIGCLVQRSDGYRVSKRVNTIDLNMQELEGLQPSKTQDLFYSADGTLASSDNYTAMLLQIADNAYSEGPGTPSQDDGEDDLYYLNLFRQYAEKWVDHSLDCGPFVLVHGDLEIFNLLFDNEINVVSVLDWEWSRVVPLQFFKPPLWLSNTPIDAMSYGFHYRSYLTFFDEFLAILRTREQERYGDTLLANEWDKAKQNSGFMVANALESWTAMDWFASRYINLRVGTKENLAERIAAFIRDDPTRKALIQRKVCDWKIYTEQLRQLYTDSQALDIPKADRPEVERFSRQDLWNVYIPRLTQTLSLIIVGIAVIIACTSYLLQRRSGLPSMSRLNAVGRLLV